MTTATSGMESGVGTGTQEVSENKTIAEKLFSELTRARFSYGNASRTESDYLLKKARYEAAREAHYDNLFETGGATAVAGAKLTENGLFKSKLLKNRLGLLDINKHKARYGITGAVIVTAVGPVRILVGATIGIGLQHAFKKFKITTGVANLINRFAGLGDVEGQTAILKKLEAEAKASGQSRQEFEATNSELVRTVSESIRNERKAKMALGMFAGAGFGLEFGHSYATEVVKQIGINNTFWVDGWFSLGGLVKATVGPAYGADPSVANNIPTSGEGQKLTAAEVLEKIQEWRREASEYIAEHIKEHPVQITPEISQVSGPVQQAFTNAIEQLQGVAGSPVPQEVQAELFKRFEGVVTAGESLTLQVKEATGAVTNYSVKFDFATDKFIVERIGNLLAAPTNFTSASGAWSWVDTNGTLHWVKGDIAETGRSQDELVTNVRTALGLDGPAESHSVTEATSSTTTGATPAPETTTAPVISTNETGKCIEGLTTVTSVKVDENCDGAITLLKSIAQAMKEAKYTANTFPGDTNPFERLLLAAQSGNPRTLDAVAGQVAQQLNMWDGANQSMVLMNGDRFELRNGQLFLIRGGRADMLADCLGETGYNKDLTTTEICKEDCVEEAPPKPPVVIVEPAPEVVVPEQRVLPPVPNEIPAHKYSPTCDPTTIRLGYSQDELIDTTRTDYRDTHPTSGHVRDLLRITVSENPSDNPKLMKDILTIWQEFLRQHPEYTAGSAIIAIDNDCDGVPEKIGCIYEDGTKIHWEAGEGRYIYGDPTEYLTDRDGRSYFRGHSNSGYSGKGPYNDEFVQVRGNYAPTGGRTGAMVTQRIPVSHLRVNDVWPVTQELGVARSLGNGTFEWSDSTPDADGSSDEFMDESRIIKDGPEMRTVGGISPIETNAAIQLINTDIAETFTAYYLDGSVKTRGDVVFAQMIESIGNPSVSAISAISENDSDLLSDAQKEVWVKVHNFIAEHRVELGVRKAGDINLLEFLRSKGITI